MFDIEEQINELIIQMENLDYEFKSDDANGIVFTKEGGNRSFRDWNEVDEFVEENREIE